MKQIPLRMYQTDAYAALPGNNLIYKYVSSDTF